MKKATIIFVLLALGIRPNLLAQYNVKAFGASGNGITLDTRAIQQAINKASENNGGTVEVPTGIYKVGTLILKDNISLHLEAGSELLGSPDYHDYTFVKQKFQSRTRNLYAKYFIIFAEDSKNISITGEGTINGNGLRYFKTIRPQNHRPVMIRLVSCKHVNIEDVHLLQSANWTLHLLNCSNVNIEGITIKTSGKGNRDGIDVDACNGVSISNSQISTTDDAIVMKSTCNKLCQNIAINNCILSSDGAAIKTGTESNGGFKNITVSNCVIKNIPTYAGISLITVDGGVLENILLENITMEKVATPIFIKLGIRLRQYKKDQYVQKIGNVSDIQLNNISVVDASSPSVIMGIPNKKLNNISINNYTCRYMEQANNQPVSYNKVPLKEFSYPMPTMFKNLPAWGLYCRSINGLYLNNINLFSQGTTTIPAFTFDKINELQLISAKATVNNLSTPMIYVRQVSGMIASLCQSLGRDSMLFEAEAGTCDGLLFYGNSLKSSQILLKKTKKLFPETLFDNFDMDSRYSVDYGGKKVQGFYSIKLSNDPVEIPLRVKGGMSAQLCLLIRNNSTKPENVIVKYDGIVQQFRIDWNSWGWAPISLTKEFKKDEKVNIEISTDTPNSHLQLSKAFIRAQSLGYTD